MSQEHPDIFDLRISGEPPQLFVSWGTFFNYIREKILFLHEPRVILNGSGELKVYEKDDNMPSIVILFFPQSYAYFRSVIWPIAAGKPTPDPTGFGQVHWHCYQNYRSQGTYPPGKNFIEVFRNPRKAASEVQKESLPAKRQRAESEVQLLPPQVEEEVLEQTPLFSLRDLLRPQALPPVPPSFPPEYEEEMLEDDEEEDDDDDDEEEEEEEEAVLEVPHPESNQETQSLEEEAESQVLPVSPWLQLFSWFDEEWVDEILHFVADAFGSLFNREEFTWLLKKAGHKWETEEERRDCYEKFCMDLVIVAVLVLEQHDANGYYYPSLTQIIEFLRAAPLGMAMGLGFRHGFTMADIMRLTKFEPGSGFFTYFYIWWIFFFGCRPNLVVRGDVLHFNLIWLKQATETEEASRSDCSVPVTVSGFFSETNLSERVIQLRKYFGMIHRQIQRAWGATSEYWYHGGGKDKYAKDWDEIKGVVGGNWIAEADPLPERRTVVMENNKFWELYFGNPEDPFWSEKMKHTLDQFRDKHVTMIPDRVGFNCFDKAFGCTCPRGTRFCECDAGRRFGGITIGEISELYKHSDIMVFEVIIYAKKDKKPRELKLIALGDTYFTGHDPRVILINNPQYHGGKAHCCLMRPEPEAEDETQEQRYNRLSFYNTFLHILVKNQQSYCPICGLVYEQKDEKVHMRKHNGKLLCEFCGISCDSSEDMEIHEHFHCRHLGMGCMYEFASEITGYREKTEKSQRIIYADLESAITEDGTHQTILCGWTDNTEYKVHISRQISELLNYAGRVREQEVLIYFHNGEGYDFHFVLLEIGKIGYEMMKGINITADSSEKIRYFDIEYKPRGCEDFKKICFRDSFAFVSQSLSKWLESTKKCPHDFKCFDKAFPDDVQRELVLQKNPFPYNAIKSAEDLERGIVAMEEWFTADNNTELFCDKYTKEELESIYRTWYIRALDTFKWRRVEDYYRTYLTCDVAQLCDVMEHFAREVQQEFDLNIHSYFGTPSLTWAAWLKHNEGKFKLEPIPEESFDVVMSSIRGGQTGAMTRLYDSETREEDKDTICFDLDCNSLYATVMLEMQYPCHDWKMSHTIPSDERLLLVWLRELHNSGRSGFIELTFDVKDDPELYSYMPVASRRRIQGYYNYRAIEEYAEEGEAPARQLFSGLCNIVGLHEHYCCHTRLLEFYLEHDFISVREVYKCIHGKDEPVFREYVKRNLDQRAAFADDAIKKMLYKLMNNSLYGKTYEDVTKRQSFKVEQRSKYEQIPEEQKKREVLKLDKWVIYETYQRSFLMDKPIYLGAAITEYSKLWMYRFFYAQIRPLYPTAQVLYTDTDALTIKFPRGVTSLQEVAHALMLRYGEQIIDTSNWSDPKIMGEGTYEHNNRPGLFKSETDDHRIVKMAALRAKTYIMVCDDGSVKMSVKGCPMKEKSKLTFEDFTDVLFGNGKTKTIEYDAIQSKYHIVKSTTMTRVVLSADDLKRYIHDDRIHTSPLFSAPHIRSLH